VTGAITVFGAKSCRDTQRSLRLLRRLAIAHAYRDVDTDLAALGRALELNGGERRTPIVELEAEVLVEPSNAEFAAALVGHEILTEEQARERINVQNVGDVERLLRVGGGLAVALAASKAPRSVRWPTRIAGVLTALTGVAGWCPVFAARGVTSIGGPGDRPDEAERKTWLAGR
jgi:hypothetical protein